MGQKIFSVVVTLLLLLAMPALHASAKSAPKPPKSAALLVQQVDIETLAGYEQQIAEIRDQLQIKKRFTDSTLRYYRRQLTTIYADLDIRSDKYKRRIDSANKLLTEFSQSQKQMQINGNEFKVDYDPYYVKKVREFKQEIAFYEGRLLQIRLLEFEIKGLMRTIARIRIEVNRSGLWHASAPFYQPETWRLAFAQIVDFSSKLHQQFKAIGKQMTERQQWVGFWCWIVISAAVFIVYFRWVLSAVLSLCDKDVKSDDVMRRSTLWVMNILLRGFIPCLYVILVFRGYFNWLSIDDFPLLLNFLRSLSNAWGFVLLAGAVSYVSCQYFYYRGRHLVDELSTPLLLLVYELGALMFVSNMSLFNLQGKPYPFYPAESTDFVVLLLSVVLLITTVWLFYRMKQVMGVKCDE